MNNRILKELIESFGVRTSKDVTEMLRGIPKGIKDWEVILFKNILIPKEK